MLECFRIKSSKNLVCVICHKKKVKCSLKEEKGEKPEGKKAKGKAKAPKVKEESSITPSRLRPVIASPSKTSLAPTVLIPSQQERAHHEKVEQGINDIIEQFKTIEKYLEGIAGLLAVVGDLQNQIAVLIETADRDRMSPSSLEVTMLTEGSGFDGPDWERIRGDNELGGTGTSCNHGPSEGAHDDKGTNLTVSIEDVAGGTSAKDVVSSAGGESPGDESSEDDNEDAAGEEDHEALTDATQPPETVEENDVAMEE
jgi:hypothetical protein